MEREHGHPVLIEFWDFCRPNSMRTLPYTRAWQERYEPDGLRVIGVHSPGFEPARERAAVEAAVARLGISYPVLLDPDLEMWQVYENRGWPVRYLFDQRGCLFDYHYGEGAYLETELAIQELLVIERDPIPSLRPEDAPDALLVAQTEDQPGAYSGPYEAGGVWAVFEGSGNVRIGATGIAGDPGEHPDTTVATELTVAHAGAYQLIEHERHTTGVLDLKIGRGVVCHATCFTPGVA